MKMVKDLQKLDGKKGYTQDGTLGRMKDKMHQLQVGNNPSYCKACSTYAVSNTTCDTR